MLKIRTIDKDDLSLASELLSKGFPRRDRYFWESGLRKLQAYSSKQQHPIGQFLIAANKPVGVLLTIPGTNPLTGGKVVNLSSWYIEEKYRWYAPKMLMDATADAHTTFTDFTPSPEVVALNKKLGFKTFTAKLALVILPFAAMGRATSDTILPLGREPAGAFSETQWHSINAHLDMGCMAFSVKRDGVCHPVILDVIRRKTVPIARVLHVSDCRLVTDNIGPIARLLLKRGLPLMSILIPQGDKAKYALTWKSDHCYQVKGNWPDVAIDELFSERVFLNV